MIQLMLTKGKVRFRHVRSYWEEGRIKKRLRSIRRASMQKALEQIKVNGLMLDF